MEASPIFYLAMTTLAFGILFGIAELRSVRSAFAEARIREPAERKLRS